MSGPGGSVGPPSTAGPEPEPPRTIDPLTWRRRDHFRFYRQFDNPFFNVCAPVDVSAVYDASRRVPDRISFFTAILYASTRAVNESEELRCRIRGERVVVHPVVHPGSTVLLADETFRFASYTYHPEYARFHEGVRRVLEAVRKDPGPLDPQADRDDRVHYTVLPWIALTSFSHPRRWGTEDAVPKIVFGRHAEGPSGRAMPVSIEVHHGLVDGLHVGRWFQRFQALLTELPRSLRRDGTPDG